MICLALESSSPHISVAMSQNQEILYEVNVASGAQKGSCLLSGIHACCMGAELPIQKVDVYAVSVGPGSFTGLRVGISTLKGLCYSFEKKIIPVNSLKVRACGIGPCRQKIAIVVDARRDRFYTAIYEWKEAQLATLIEPAIRSLKQFAPFLSPECVMGGDISPGHRKALEDICAMKFEPCQGETHIPRAGSVLRLAWKEIEQNRLSDYNRIVPEYLWGEDS